MAATPGAGEPPRRRGGAEGGPWGAAPAARPAAGAGRGIAIGIATAVVVLIAAVLRFWRLDWALVDGTWFLDESSIWRHYLTVFRPTSPATWLPPSLHYPSFCGYVTGFAVAVADAAGAPVRGPDVTVGAIYAGRAAAAVCGIAGVALVGVLGARFYSTAAGLAAAALLAAAPLEAMQVHYLSADALLSACTAAALLAACELLRRPGALRAALAGAAVGLGAATKYNGIALLVLPGWAVLEVLWRRRSWKVAVVLAAAVAGGFAVAVVVACPQCVLRPDLMGVALARHRGLMNAYRFLNQSLTPALGWLGKPYLYQLFASLPFGLGWPLWLASLAGVALALRRRTVADRLSLVWIASYFAVVGGAKNTFWRYLLPLFPALALLAGRWFAEPGRLRPLRLGAFAACLAYTVALSFSQVDRFSYDQQRAVASFVAAARARIAPGASDPAVAVPDSFWAYLGLAKPLREVGLRPVPVKNGQWFRDAPEFFVLPTWTAIAWPRTWPGSVPARDVVRLEAGDAGYREVARFESRFLQQSWYTWLDPAFQSDLWQGEIGFTVYVRADLAAALASTEAPSPAPAAP